MNEWPAAVWASISAMTAALVLSLVFMLGSFAREAVKIQQTDEDAIAIIQEYREYSRYDGTKGLYPSDVITAISESRGFPEIWVDKEEGQREDFSLKWTRDSAPEDFATANLVEEFPLVALYDATLIRDLNGVVSRIEFRRQ